LPPRRGRIATKDTKDTKRKEKEKEKMKEKRKTRKDWNL